jgi:GT2 family glycosyltransferase
VVKIGLILVTHSRPELLRKQLRMFEAQTRQDFHLIVTHGNKDNWTEVRRLVKQYRPGSTVRYDGNELYSFRRIVVAKELHQDYDVFLFLDDDVTIPPNYVEEAIKQFQPETYKSWWAWQLNGKPYQKLEDRTRITMPGVPVAYGGTGVAMVDAKLCAVPELFDYPEHAPRMEDLWFSFVLGHMHKVPITYLDVEGVVLGGHDSKALYKRILKSSYRKVHFVDMLRKDYGWDA